MQKRQQIKVARVAHDTCLGQEAGDLFQAFLRWIRSRNKNTTPPGKESGRGQAEEA